MLRPDPEGLVVYMIKKFVPVVLALVSAVNLSAAVKLPAVVSDNMVLQQQSDARLWGWATPGEKVVVQGSWAKASSKPVMADKDGKWKISIRTPKAGGPYTITVKGNNTLTLKNILIGEVWVCSGQSNMEWGLSWMNNAKQEVAEANHPEIRLFDVKNTTASLPLDDVTGQWYECTSESVATCGEFGGFSAAAYYFGRKLQEQLKVPIGLITADVRGTPAESWASSEMLLTMPDFSEQVKTVSDRGALKKAMGKYEIDLARWQEAIEKADAGTREKWETPKLDESSWKRIEVPSTFEESQIGEMDGVVWYRTTLELPADLAGKEMTVSLGAIDDEEITYFNGTKIGEVKGWNRARRYKVEGSLVKAGKNVLAIRVLDTRGAGGFAAKPDDMFLQSGEKKVAIAGQWLYRISFDLSSIPRAPRRPGGMSNQSPTSLYNGMINPIVPFTIKGAIWYQGEGNSLKPTQYQTLFPNMIQSWRNAWKIGDFPFYYAQIAPYNYGDRNSAFLREAQMMTLSMTNVGMAVTMDIGDFNDIHPRNKRDVGLRLARWALAKDYGQKDLVYSGPIYKSMQTEGGKIRLSFDYTGSGMVAKDGKLANFMVAGADQTFVQATATIDNDTIVVASDDVAEPVAVRYAFDNAGLPSLFNKEGLPASSFRTDSW
jgi:sialate O-acetylesterase